MLSPWCSTTWRDTRPCLSKTVLLAETQPRRFQLDHCLEDASDLLMDVGFCCLHRRGTNEQGSRSAPTGFDPGRRSGSDPGDECVRSAGLTTRRP